MLLPYLGLLLSGATALWFILVLADSADEGKEDVIGAREGVSGVVFVVVLMSTIIGSSFIS